MQGLVAPVGQRQGDAEHEARVRRLLLGARESDPLLHVRVPQLQDPDAVDTGNGGKRSDTRNGGKQRDDTRNGGK